MTLDELQQWFARNRTRYMAEWEELLRFPSISTDPAHDVDGLQCAQWLEQHLASLGFEASILDTPSKPCVYAEYAGDTNRPAVLCYGHYDVQPPDPLDEWNTDPFDPTWIGERLYARGAEDNKGQLMYLLKALETLRAHDALQGPVKILIEGEEESGSHGLAAVAADWGNRLQADVLMITDVGTVGSGAPTLIMGLRGIAFLSLELRGATHDLHSGVHGGLAPNAAQELARLLAGLHDRQGRVAVAGFHDGVADPSTAELALAARAGRERAEYLARTSIAPSGGERNRSAAERIGFRPTLEINGMTAGYAGHGIKTIIPAVATAKLSARLVPRQDPEHCLNAIVTHLRQQVPDGLRLEITEQGIGGPGLRMDPASPLMRQAREVLEQLSPEKPAFLWEGASIPIVTALAAASGAQPLLCGFGHEDDNIHAPNESFSLEQFRRGYLYAGLVIQKLQA